MVDKVFTYHAEWLLINTSFCNKRTLRVYTITHAWLLYCNSSLLSKYKNRIICIELCLRLFLIMV